LVKVFDLNKFFDENSGVDPSIPTKFDDIQSMMKAKD